MNMAKYPLMEKRIVCAANRLEGYVLLIGARHWDTLMHHQFNRLGLPKDMGEEISHECVQGFIDNHGKFLTRTEAWKVAEAAGQIIHRCGGDTADGGTLYSENLY